MHQIEKFQKMENNLWNNKNTGSLNGLVLSCPTRRVLVKKLKSILGQFRIPHAAHHYFENEDSQLIIAHFDENKTYIATHQGWHVCPHSITKKLLQVYHSPDNGQTLRSHDLFISAAGLQNKGIGLRLTPPPPPFIFCIWSAMVCISPCTKVTLWCPCSNFA
jgi:hypothetical protein